MSVRLCFHFGTFCSLFNFFSFCDDTFFFVFSSFFSRFATEFPGCTNTAHYFITGSGNACTEHEILVRIVEDTESKTCFALILTNADSDFRRSFRVVTHCTEVSDSSCHSTDFVYTADELEEMASLVQTCPDTVRVNALNRNLEVALRYALGQRYPDFDLIRTDGTSARLSALIPAEAQFTLLDFWASWCGPCRAAIPRVKELAVQYGSRLGLVSVSVDEKETAWRKAMEEEQMTWAQAWLNKVQVPAAADGYMLTTIPRLVLIDGEGRIVCSTNLPDVIVEYLQNHMKP